MTGGIPSKNYRPKTSQKKGSNWHFRKKAKSCYFCGALISGSDRDYCKKCGKDQKR